MEVAAKSQIWRVDILTVCYEIPGCNYSWYFMMGLWNVKLS